ncbi:metal ABC transporter permease [soil metagenome]
MSLLELELMRRALMAAALVGAAAPAIGVFLVQRRLSLMGDGIGHVAFIGVAAALLTSTAPIVWTIAAATLGAVALELLRERGRVAGDVALALIFYGGIAGGLLLTDLGNASNTNLLSALFGSVLTVSAADLVSVAIISVAVVVVTVALRKELFVVCYDEEVARASGLPVRTLNLTIAITAAVTVAVTLQVVGILLVAAMLVLPVAAVQQVTHSFRATVLASQALGVAVSVGGLVLAYYADVRPAATIVACGIVAFLVATRLGPLRMRNWGHGQP